LQQRKEYYLGKEKNAAASKKSITTSKKSYPITEVTFLKSPGDRNWGGTTENSDIEGLNMSAAIGEEILDEFPEDRLSKPLQQTTSTPQ
jgi:hypothetical protein